MQPLVFSMQLLARHKNVMVMFLEMNVLEGSKDGCTGRNLHFDSTIWR